MRVLAAAVFVATAWAAAPFDAAAADACAAAHRGCIAQCDRSFPAQRDDLGRAGCQARCGWDGATCAAQGALDETRSTLDRDLKPWLTDQADRWQRFLDGFRRGGAGERPGEPPHSRPDRGPGTSL